MASILTATVSQSGSVIDCTTDALAEMSSAGQHGISVTASGISIPCSVSFNSTDIQITLTSVIVTGEVVVVTVSGSDVTDGTTTLADATITADNTSEASSALRVGRDGLVVSQDGMTVTVPIAAEQGDIQLPLSGDAGIIVADSDGNNLNIVVSISTNGSNAIVTLSDKMYKDYSIGVIVSSSNITDGRGRLLIDDTSNIPIGVDSAPSWPQMHVSSVKFSASDTIDATVTNVRGSTLALSSGETATGVKVYKNDVEITPESITLGTSDISIVLSDAINENDYVELSYADGNIVDDAAAYGVSATPLVAYTRAAIFTNHPQTIQSDGNGSASIVATTKFNNVGSVVGRADVAVSMIPMQHATSITLRTRKVVYQDKDGSPVTKKDSVSVDLDGYKSAGVTLGRPRIPTQKDL